jgi:hypothetical protein
MSALIEGCDRLVGRNVGQQPPKLGRLLDGDPAVPIQVDRPVGHDLLARIGVN